MSSQFARVFRYHRFIWRYSGTWYDDQADGPNLPAHVAYIAWALLLNAALVYFWLGIWHYLGSGVADLMEANDVLTFGSIFALVTVKTVLFVRSRRRCAAILAQIERMERTIEADAQGAEQRIVRRTVAEMLRVGCIIGIVGGCAAFSHFALTQLVGNGGGGRLLVFPASTPYAWQDDAVAFYATNTFQLVFALYAAVQLATLDIVGPHMYMALRAFVEVLAERVAQIGGGEDGDGGCGGGDQKRVDVELRQTRRCVKWHLECLRLGALLERMFGVQYFVQFGASSFGICTSTFVMSQINFLENPVGYLFTMLCCFGLAAQIFIPCYYGSSLLRASERLTSQIYAPHWITTGTDAGRAGRRSGKTALMLIFVERARRPVALRTFAGLFRIELPTFVMVLRTAHSMLSCLTQMA